MFQMSLILLCIVVSVCWIKLGFRAKMQVTSQSESFRPLDPSLPGLGFWEVRRFRRLNREHCAWSWIRRVNCKLGSLFSGNIRHHRRLSFSHESSFENKTFTLLLPSLRFLPLPHFWHHVVFSHNKYQQIEVSFFRISGYFHLFSRTHNMELLLACLLSCCSAPNFSFLSHHTYQGIENISRLNGNLSF